MQQLDLISDRSAGDSDSLLSRYRAKIQALWETLMDREATLCDQLEEVIKEFERNMSDMINFFVENTQPLHLGLMEDLDSHHISSPLGKG
ncbi:unnamed protein product [Protopolystoma xenopodis]|uniref:Uncharacterized protein n=1 Tax=Protopolystoma xenopodis TaxID=117903 RepID=A0A3S5FEB3_9PLAT|nr:unnamed protein product [Protopolystoma xenopodis]